MEQRKKHILVVDDSAIQLRNVKSWLQDTYRISLATSGAQAIEQMQNSRPDLILLDYEMPVCNGKRFFEILQANESTKDIPVVFLTSVADQGHIEEVLCMKPAGYLLKPVGLDKLRSVVAGILQ